MTAPAKLLAEAAKAGLTLRAEGDTLRIAGPPEAEDLAKRLIAAKSALLPLLRPASAPLWDDAEMQRLLTATLRRIGQASGSHRGLLDGDTQLADLMEAVDLAYLHRDREATVAALERLESYTMGRYREAPPSPTEPGFDVADIVAGLRKYQVTLTTHVDEEGRTWPQLVQREGRDIPRALIAAVAGNWRAVLVALDDGGPPIE